MKNQTLGGFLSSKDLIQENLLKIKNFIQKSSGLELKEERGALKIHQKLDGKNLPIDPRKIEDVLIRKDTEEQVFLQVNFIEGKKILLTETLIGFKPVVPMNLDINKLPKVVTTPDLINVVEAIEESMNQGDDEYHMSLNPESKIDTLHQVFNSVLSGGESIGFDLSSEKEWVRRLISCRSKISSV